MWESDTASPLQSLTPPTSAGLATTLWSSSSSSSTTQPTPPSSSRDSWESIVPWTYHWVLMKQDVDSYLSLHVDPDLLTKISWSEALHIIYWCIMSFNETHTTLQTTWRKEKPLKFSGLFTKLFAWKNATMIVNVFWCNRRVQTSLNSVLETQS